MIYGNEKYLNALKMSYLNLLERDDREWWLRELNQCIGSRRHEHIAAMWHTIEAELTERNID